MRIKALPMSLVAARNAVQPGSNKITAVATVADSNVNNAKCTQLHAQLVARKPRYLSSPPAKGLCIAEIATSLAADTKLLQRPSRVKTWEGLFYYAR